MGVVVPDRPGELARLFVPVGAMGINVEDVRVEHSHEEQRGEVELAVRQPVADSLAEQLQRRAGVPTAGNEMAMRKAVGDPLVVAVDGPGGSGKSTVARALARRLGVRYLDTGAMYRAVTWLALQRRLDIEDAERLAELAERAVLSVATDPMPRDRR